MRELSKMDPRELRERDSIGLHQARDRIQAAQLLDQCDDAKTVDDLRAIISALITRISGEK